MDMQEDGWVVCRVFKKKNLFKVGNGNEGGSSINSSDHQHLNTTTSQPRSFIHRSNEQYLVRPNGSPTPIQHNFELNKAELALHYPPMPTNSTTQYSLFQPQTLGLVQTHKPIGYDYAALPPDSPVMIKQLMSNPRDCESTGSESLRYQQACEPGLEVGTCEATPQQMGVTGRDDHEWGMLDRLVTSHMGNEDSSKGVRFQDTNPINQLSLRGEMDFWGYGK
ncbi:hypothetical protein CCACVL1_29763 [Corchorus capsularis]|uniref:No apical meristem (NAM) protein n=1 Tax=Corchorus capsularis TaxID=210143 RepID=A0A1R3G080_COCAP|nr:hypothetical protein CCACVL1_29763 [Corchorus capsularis]